MTNIVAIKDLSLRIGQRLLYKDLSLRVPADSITALMGPAGSGKSTLLNLLAGKMTASHIDIQGSLKTRCRDGCDDGWVQVMKQHPTALVRPAVEWLRPRAKGYRIPELEAQLEHIGALPLLGRLEECPIDWPLALRRLLLLVGHILEDPDLLCLDEPFARLDDDEAAPLVELVESQRGKRTILLCTHHQRRARRVSDRVALLAGGRIIESAPTDRFFDAPQTEPARTFVRTGSCCVPSPDTPPEFLSAEFRSPSSPKSASSTPCTSSSQTKNASPSTSPSDPGDSAELESRPRSPSSTNCGEPSRSSAPKSPCRGPADGRPQPPPPESYSLSEISSHVESSESLQRVEGVTSPASTSASVLLEARWRQHDDVNMVEPMIFRRPPYEAAWRGPSEFHWIWPGLLAGVARPGLLRPLRSDLDALIRVGIDAVVTLNEAPLNVKIVREMGLEYHHLPIVDMTPPTIDEAIETCRWVDRQLEDGLAVVYHCRAGIGRTGTMLASQIISTVHSPADETLARIRQVLSRYVQSPSQERFLHRLYDHVGSVSAPPA